jgi:hypothetical protein
VTQNPESSSRLGSVNQQCKVTVNPTGGPDQPPPDRRALIIKAAIAGCTLASTTLWVIWGGDSPQVAVTLVEIVI